VSTSYIERIEISNPQRLRSYTAMFLLPLGYMPSLVWCIENLFYTHSCWYPLYRNVGQIGASCIFKIGWNNKKFFCQFFIAHTEILEMLYKANEAYEIYHLPRVCAKPYIIFQRIDKPFTQCLGCYRSRL